MNVSSRYWKIWRINPAAGKIGYKLVTVKAAQDFVDSEFQEQDEQNTLLSCFNREKNDADTINRARATLCLRCYVSEAILKQCKKLDALFSGEKQFNYRDLLPFVLNDDGEKLIVLDRDGKTQLMVNEGGQTKQSRYNFFSVKVLQTFNPELQSRMSLDNWTYLQTKQNPELKIFLSEFGFKNLSNWALLNRARKKQLENLLYEERCVVEAFHAVYRRDRQQQKNRVTKKCPDPTNDQLEEMLAYLKPKKVRINTPFQLIKELKQIVLSKKINSYFKSATPNYL